MIAYNLFSIFIIFFCSLGSTDVSVKDYGSSEYGGNNVLMCSGT